VLKIINFFIYEYNSVFYHVIIIFIYSMFYGLYKNNKST
jgi:hypothetical protein